MTLPLAFLLVFGFLGALTIWWGRGRIRRKRRMPRRRAISAFTDPVPTDTVPGVSRRN